jgi:UDP-N-acetylglucosamine acyltransferase
MRPPARAEVVVHPTAVVDKEAELEPGVSVGPYCVIEGGVRVGAGTEVRAASQILRGTTLGRENRIGPSAIIGGEPMDLKFKGEASYLEIGDRNVIREFSTVHRATGEGEVTRIGHDNFIMAYVHITHNCIVGNHTIIPNAAQVAGHVVIEDHVTFGATVGVHQFCRIGAHAMVGMNSKVTRDILPYSLADGHPAQHYLLNAVGLRRRGIRGEEYALLGEAGPGDPCRGVARALPRAGEDHRHLAHLLEFVSLPSPRGLSGFASRPHAPERG